MARYCSMCGSEIDDYYIEEYIEELNGQGCYCRTCREFLKTKHGKGPENGEKQKKVQVDWSDFPLPGFIHDGKRFVRKSKARKRSCD